MRLRSRSRLKSVRSPLRDSGFNVMRAVTPGDARCSHATAPTSMAISMPNRRTRVFVMMLLR
jgi:hypothetical protein